jgi:TolB protein
MGAACLMRRDSPSSSAPKTRWRLAVACLLLLGACTTGARPSLAPAFTAAAPTPSQSEPGLSTAPPAGRIPGEIAYGTAEGDLWVLNGDGTHRRQLTHSGPDIHFDPSWAPDGRRIVFRISSDRDHIRDPDGIGLDSIGVVEVANGRLTLIQPPQGALFPDWSPVGNLILLSTVDGGRHAFAGGGHPVDTVHTIRPDGSSLRALTHRMGECGAWSPDATKILFCSNPGNGDFETCVMDADRSHVRQLTSSSGKDQGAIWSPNGRRIVFTSTRSGDGELWVMNADGSNQHPLLRLPGTNEAPDAWLPQGIVFASFVPDAAVPTWFIMRPDGTHLRSLPQLHGVPDPIDWIQPSAHR